MIRNNNNNNNKKFSSIAELNFIKAGLIYTKLKIFFLFFFFFKITVDFHVRTICNRIGGISR